MIKFFNETIHWSDRLEIRTLAYILYVTYPKFVSIIYCFKTFVAASHL